MSGYSAKINDPAFEKYLLNTNRWSAIFSVMIAVAAVIGFYIYGETSQEMDNPQALFIGMGIGCMFILIAFYQVVSRKKSKTWDGTVTEKTAEKKRKNQNSSNDDYYVSYYTEYKIIITDDKGKKHTIVQEDDDIVYDYFNVGDRVRHHKGLNSYEKYDKSKDSIVFCNACGSLNDISDDHCLRCSCPLLK